MEKYVCIHGHFYQPPRENPWLEEVELQDSAKPYHDWNDRITAECYGPNAASRLLDEQRKIMDIVNNYSKMSFNFGPTLLSWLEDQRPDVYEHLLEADKESMKHFGGHGAAMAQCYNHMIMPLANRRDKVTQIKWGIRDFESRFGRKPEGMWLPETAVDSESLEIMAEHGIKFTILAPRQCSKIRKIGEEEWIDVSGERVDPRLPYLCRLGNGMEMTLFFYDGHISQDIAFKGLLKSGADLANRLLGTLDDKSEYDSQLVHVATDGETYGHHHYHGDMALAFAVNHIESNNLAKITIYAEFLEKHNAVYEAEIFENSSWSCVHGVERWQSNCGCCSGMNPNWHQKWRGPLRGAFDWLRDNVCQIYEDQMSKWTDDPWKCRDNYIDLILDRSDENIEKFIEENFHTSLQKEELATALKCLEMQRHAMLMYTSCGWFFDDVSGIETIQVIQYAARALQLANEVEHVDITDAFKKLLDRVVSNVSKYRTGLGVYREHVETSALDLLRVGAHYAISSVFEEELPEKEKVQLYAFDIEKIEGEKSIVGKQQLMIGRAKVKNNIILEEDVVTFAVLHLGDHNLVAGVRYYQGLKKTYSKSFETIKEAFSKSDIARCIGLIEKNFTGHTFSLWHLFKDEQRRVLNQLLEQTIEDVESSIRQIFENYYPIMQGIRQMDVTLPPLLASTVEMMLNTDLVSSVEQNPPDLKQFKELLDQARDWSSEIDRDKLGFVIGTRVTELVQSLYDNPDDLESLESCVNLLSMTQEWELKQDLWQAQNLYFEVGKDHYPNRKKADSDETKVKWVEEFTKLGDLLNIRIE